MQGKYNDTGVRVHSTLTCKILLVVNCTVVPLRIQSLVAPARSSGVELQYLVLKFVRILYQ